MLLDRPAAIIVFMAVGDRFHAPALLCNMPHSRCFIVFGARHRKTRLNLARPSNLGPLNPVSTARPDVRTGHGVRTSGEISSRRGCGPPAGMHIGERIGGALIVEGIFGVAADAGLSLSTGWFQTPP